ncbi:WGR domain-containing protein [Myxococcus stipitatus DSM 14675]|uniref:WGR domain-containing protein n=1 Tax=Myxococcus stipitatus (strain DSM 14675 / JCM 12634 / Mx s8) TaxID=1278073 RepID=L7UFK7_MYXSD|nr:WGR domain-containing protein [Myxococcus stipitatus]AGC47731.1 WGR domain-containing protein [Myxococcus stipitatus DSM 14675]
MRRFEFVEGTSSKFWQPEVQGNVFIVTFGRIGTAGQRKEKGFPDAAAAQREYEKKVAEKVREGYVEVTDGAAAPAPAAAPVAPPKPQLPGRVPAATVTPESLKAAADALAGLRARLGWRSWEVTSRARNARRALRALGGVDPTAHAELSSTFDALMARVVVAPKEGRLPLRHALGLLSELDVAAYSRAVALWRKAYEPGSLAAVSSVESLGVPELSLRLSLLLAERPGMKGSASEEGWAKRWSVLRPHVEEKLTESGGSLSDWVKGVNAGSDTQLAGRLARLGA